MWCLLAYPNTCSLLGFLSITVTVIHTRVHANILAFSTRTHPKLPPAQGLPSLSFFLLTSLLCQLCTLDSFCLCLLLSSAPCSAPAPLMARSSPLLSLSALKCSRSLWLFSPYIYNKNPSLNHTISGRVVSLYNLPIF